MVDLHIYYTSSISKLFTNIVKNLVGLFGVRFQLKFFYSLAVFVFAPDYTPTNTPRAPALGKSGLFLMDSSTSRREISPFL